MPEEKKEKFTFSDKIKASKPAGSKSFAKPASKIGKDGKPKQTLFERTRRDAPFFIAALVALLLLPFLYKYSGTSNEEELTIPVSEENIFNPDHFGFDTAFTEDPDGQIAQLSGRDSLSLIRGFGSGDEDNFGRDDLDFDASSAAGYDYNADAEGKYAAAHHESSDMDIEENTTNIYKRRAKKGTRAAFRRAATKIGNLSPAAMRRPGGAPFNVRNWGGSMKTAAQKVKPTTPTEGPKPVSLQPLRAKSGRSSFGGTGKAGRASRAALGKADARQALRDANVKPVEPTRVGGLDMFSMGPGGGGGRLERNINIGKGQEPWWWDMMKTRMQKEWEKRFERKWKWIDWADQIAMNILKGLINCLITGDSDGDVDFFFGSGGGAGGKAAKCCGVAADGWKQELAEIGASALTESSCKTILKKKYGDAKYKEACGADFWEKGSSAGGGRVGFFGQRLKCLGVNVGLYGSGELRLKGAGLDCANMPDYRVVPSGEALKWNIYTYVVVRNYFPDNLKAKFPALTVKDGAQKNLLCAPGNSSLNHAKIATGAGHVDSQKDSAMQQIITQTRATDNVPEEQQKIRTRILEVDQEALKDACVMAVAQGSYLSYEAVKNAIIDRFKELGNGKVSDDEAVQAFYQLDLMFAGSFAAKDKLAYAQWFESGHNIRTMLPLPYWEFENAYILHKKTTHKLDGSRDKVYKKKRWRMEGVDMIRGPICYYDNSIQLECVEEEMPQVRVRFGEGYKGLDKRDITADSEIKNIDVTAKFIPLNASDGTEQPLDRQTPQVTPDGKGLIYTFGFAINQDKTAKDELKNQIGNIVYKVYRKGATHVDSSHTGIEEKNAVYTLKCPYNMSGDVPQPSLPETQTDCTNGQTQEQMVDRQGKQCKQIRRCESNRWGNWADDPNDPNCQASGEQTVGFYSWVKKIPCETDNKVLNGDLRVVTSDADCLKWSTCRLTVDNRKLFPLDEQTKEYVKKAQEKFNAANSSKNIKLTYDEENLTIANLIDAIMIDPLNGQVPKNTVCLLGKSIGANARDPQANQFDNLFGAFFAFMGYDAASFPGKWTTDCTTGNRVTNLRFPCGLKNGKNYWWGGYVDRGLRAGYKQKVDAGPWKGFPLSALLRTPLATKANGIDLAETDDKKSRKAFHDMYADLETTAVCNYGTETMSRADVLKYISILCEYGEQIKPEAWKRCPGGPNAQNQNTVGNRDASDCVGGDC